MGGFRAYSYVFNPNFSFDALRLVDSTWRGMNFDQQRTYFGQNYPNVQFLSGPHTNGTEGHWQSMLDQAETMGKSGQYDNIYLNEGLNNEAGIGAVSPNSRPDVYGVKPDGTVDQYEVPSKTDSESKLRDRMDQNEQNLLSCCPGKFKPGTKGIIPPTS